jgi:predicted metalloprotease
VSGEEREDWVADEVNTEGWKDVFAGVYGDEGADSAALEAGDRRESALAEGEGEKIARKKSKSNCTWVSA